MLVAVKDRHAADWEDLARREPYFAVLTDEGLPGVAANTSATTAFFDTGEADIASLLAAIRSVLGREAPLTSVLDFGCGVGRLTLPLARRASQVVACDVAPTMLAHARQNAERGGLRNVTFIQSDELAGLAPGAFDFICSLLVFEHIPAAAGYENIRILLNLLAPGGVAALHVILQRPGGPPRRLDRLIRARSVLAHRPPGAVQREPLPVPYSQANEYDERSILRDLEEAEARLVARLPTHHGDTTGAVLVIEKASSTVRA
jgi:SAM-dependent methyltransferase